MALPNSLKKLTVRVWPLMGVAAWQTHQGGAWRLWATAHSLDVAGSGRVTLAELRQAFKVLGVPRRTFYNWLNAAKDSGLVLEKTWNASGEKVLFLAGHGKACLVLGCADPGRKSVRVSAVKLTQKGQDGWKGEVWAALIKSLEQVHHRKSGGVIRAHRKPVTINRDKLLKMTGVSRRYQRYLEKAGGVKTRRNYVTRPNKRIDPEFLTSNREELLDQGLIKENTFPVFRKDTGKWVEGERLPDTRRVTPKRYEAPIKGRAGKILAEVENGITEAITQGLYIVPRIVEYIEDMQHPRAYCASDGIRLFYHFKKGDALQAVGRLRKADITPYMVAEVFYRVGGGWNKPVQWEAVPNV